MQLPQLRSFVTICDIRHFTRAAEQLNLTQPSLSQQIKALERELGATLFQRARGNIAPTDAGTALLPVARRILADADLAYRQVTDTAQLRVGRVRLGAPPSLCTSLVPDIFALFHDRFPGIELVVDENGSQDLVRTLVDGQLDLALIITHHARDPAALRVTELLEEELVVASAPHSSPPVNRSRIDVADLRGCPLVMFRHGYDLRESTITACRQAGFEPTFAVEGGEMDAALGFVRAGLGLAVVPSMVADRSGLRVTRFSASGPKRTIAVAHRRDAEPPRAARELYRMLLEHLRAEQDAGELPPNTTLLTEVFEEKAV